MLSFRIKAINYLSLIKFSHTVFALPFALIGFFLGLKHLSAPFNPTLFVFVILAMVFARSAAMAFNRFIDKDIDSKNPRTSSREIPSKTILPQKAFLFVLINATLFISSTFFINKLCFYLSPIALFVILGYSFTKRFTALCHIVLGIGLALAPIGAYLAVVGEFNILPLLFSFAVLFWVSGFDIIYALQDIAFDSTQKLKSIPVLLGKKKALQVSKTLHFLTLCFIFYAGFYASFGILYWIGSLFFSTLIVYQHTLIKPDDLSKVNVAFFTLNGIASIVFAFFLIADLFL